MKILITGSNGFLGRELKYQLSSFSHIEYIELGRKTDLESIKKIINEITLCVNLAAEVNPNRSLKEFCESNINFVLDLVELLSSHPIPVYHFSSVHTENPKNIYGYSKKISELIINEYSINKRIRSHIIKLPHVFGPGCKPNYNSFLTTMIANKLLGKKNNIENKNQKISYVFSKEVINNLIYSINQNKDFLMPQIYEITIGEVQEIIADINNPKHKKNPIYPKLLYTYNYYEKNLNF